MVMTLGERWLRDDLHVIAAFLHQLHVKLVVAVPGADVGVVVAVKVAEDLRGDAVGVIVRMGVDDHMFPRNAVFL